MPLRRNRPAAEPRGRLRVHRNVTVLETDTATQLEEILALPQARSALVRRLDSCCVVLDAGRLGPLLAALERHGMMPRVTADSGEG